MTAFQRQPSLGSVTTSVFGDFDARLSVVPLKFVVQTVGVVRTPLMFIFALLQSHTHARLCRQLIVPAFRDVSAMAT